MLRMGYIKNTKKNYHKNAIMANLIKNVRKIGQLLIIFIKLWWIGLSTHTINSIRANKAAKTLSMDIFVPKATAKGLYHMQ